MLTDELAAIQEVLRISDRKHDAWDKARAAIGAIEAALAAAVAPQEGYVLVPVEITPAMQKTYFDVIDKNMDRVSTDVHFGRHDSQKEAYRAMLQAAIRGRP